MDATISPTLTSAARRWMVSHPQAAAVLAVQGMQPWYFAQYVENAAALNLPEPAFMPGDKVIPRAGLNRGKEVQITHVQLIDGSVNGRIMVQWRYTCPGLGQAYHWDFTRV